MLLWKPPKVLTLHLKRFEQSERGLKKVNKHIEFPLRLDLSPFCHKNDMVCILINLYNVYRPINQPICQLMNLMISQSVNMNQSISGSLTLSFSRRFHHIYLTIIMM